LYGWSERPLEGVTEQRELSSVADCVEDRLTHVLWWRGCGDRLARFWLVQPALKNFFTFFQRGPRNPLLRVHQRVSEAFHLQVVLVVFLFVLVKFMNDTR